MTGQVLSYSCNIYLKHKACVSCSLNLALFCSFHEYLHCEFLRNLLNMNCSASSPSWPPFSPFLVFLLYLISLHLGPLPEIRSPATVYSLPKPIFCPLLIISFWQIRDDWKQSLHNIETEDVWPCPCLGGRQMPVHRNQYVNTQGIITTPNRLPWFVLTQTVKKKQIVVLWY